MSKAKPAPAAEIPASAEPAFRPTLHAEIRPDPANPRREFDDDGLAELAASIAADGLLEPLVIRQIGGEAGFMLIAGERRWRAIGQAIFAGSWPADRLIPTMLRQVDERDARRLALVENLQRRDLKPIEEARALQALAELTGASAAQIGRDLGFTGRWAQQRLQLLELPEGLQHQLERGTLKVEDARAAAALLPKLPAIKVAELERGAITVAAAKAWLDEQPKPPELSPAQWVMALEIRDAMQRRPMKKASYEYERTEVGQAAKGDADLTALVRAGLYSGPSEHQDAHYERTGRLYVSLQWQTLAKLDLKFGERYRPGGEAMQAVLDEARAAAGLNVEAGPYSTAWLNGPIEVPAAAAERYAKVLADRKKADAKEKARKDREKQAAADRKANATSNDETVRQLLEDLAAQPPAACDPRFAEALVKAGLPAPWRTEERARLVAANGEEVMHGVWYMDEQPEVVAQRALVALAVNLAAGAALTPPALADDQVDLEEAIAATAAVEAAKVDDDAAAEALSETPSLQRLAGVRQPIAAAH